MKEKVFRGVRVVHEPYTPPPHVEHLRYSLDVYDERGSIVEVLGRLADLSVAHAATCLADAGDLWAYATPIVHASERASNPRRRRVLQVDYASTPLPGGLEWLGIGGL